MNRNVELFENYIKLFVRKIRIVQITTGRTYEIVKLDVDSISSGVYHFEGVRAEAIHVSIAIGSSQIGEKVHHLVRGFMAGRDEVPEHVLILRQAQGLSDTRLTLQLIKKLHTPV
jgi:hypothetical protein